MLCLTAVGKGGTHGEKSWFDKGVTGHKHINKGKTVGGIAKKNTLKNKAQAPAKKLWHQISVTAAILRKVCNIVQ